MEDLAIVVDALLKSITNNLLVLATRLNDLLRGHNFLLA